MTAGTGNDEEQEQATANAGILRYAQNDRVREGTMNRAAEKGGCMLVHNHG
jgi:hypothetical protein